MTALSTKNTVEPSILSQAQLLLEQKFARHSPRSIELWKQANQTLTGGVAHDNRNTGVPALYVKDAQGAYTRDVDSNSYVDYWVGHGSLLLGHTHPEIVQAIQKAASEITHPGACHEREVRWAEWIQKLIPTAERVRFTSSGSEATALAVRLARARTGRDVIVKFDGHFHGWLDHATPGVDVPYEAPWSQGVPDAVRALTRCVPSKIEAVEIALKNGDVAAVILEPTGGAGGALPVSPLFLKELRELCTRHGTLLIFDEVITGFRVATGGAQQLFGVLPDLTCLAKILAGGMPGGAVCGLKASFAPMEFSGNSKQDRLNRVYQYGTYNAAPVCAAAGETMLRLVSDGKALTQAAQFTEQLKTRLNQLFRDQDVPWAVYGFSSVFHLFTACAETGVKLREGSISPLEVSSVLLKQKGAVDGVLRRALQLNGVNLPPGRQAWVSAAHGTKELDETLRAFKASIELLRELKCV